MGSECAWTSRLGDDTWRCTGDHSGGVHHFEGAAWTLPLAMTDIAGLTRLEPSGAGVDVREMLAERGLAPRPPVVCLCGSTRFVDEFNRQRKALTEAGEIVLSIEVVTTQAREDDPQHCDPQLKARLDELHKRKIDMAGYCLILNVGGYIGESTRSEIAYALEHGKPVTYLEAPDA